jgi:REP-associated tyrosine transposase
MKFIPNNIYHIYNQGNNHQKIFFSEGDYLIFLNLYKKLFLALVDTIAWCLMPNHFHFMVYTDERCNKANKQGGIIIDPITNSVRKLLSGYARIFNNSSGRSGSLFRQKTKAKCLSDIKANVSNLSCPQDYYINCFHYIHQNPLRAKLVTHLENWKFSSFKDYAGFRNGAICKKELAEMYCLYSPDTFLKQSYELIPEEIMSYLK